MTDRSPTSNQVLYQEWLSFAGAKQLPAYALEQRTVTTASVTFSQSLQPGIPYRVYLDGDPSAGGAIFTLNGVDPSATAPTGSNVGLPLPPNASGPQGNGIEFLCVSGSQELRVYKRSGSGTITLYALSNKVLVPGLV